jgi:hypothetical protein
MPAKAKQPQTSNELVQTAVKLTANMAEQIGSLAEHVRGGKSEVMRRALAAGLPVLRISLERRKLK